MRINHIRMKNFGSYEGENSFDTRTTREKNIIIFGGKNGAGKTTLFTAVTLCLYGCLSMGYKSNNTYYIRKISKLINDNAKKNNCAQALVEVSLDIPLGNDCVEYVLRRSWTQNDSFEEKFEVFRNGLELSGDDVADFEKFIQNIIPPELFNLYFFDGEQIAEFFMGDKNDKRVKTAFLTLCGYDVFEIMRKNFKRLSGIISKDDTLSEYISAKEAFENAKDEYERIKRNKEFLEKELHDINSEISRVDKEFSVSGGVSEKEWVDLLTIIKDEERKRENWNAELKKHANDTIPFLMIKPLLMRVAEQIKEEQNLKKYINALEAMRELEVIEFIKLKTENAHAELLDGLESIFLSRIKNENEHILDLSFEEIVNVSGKISGFLNYDVSDITSLKKRVKQSIKKSAKTRAKIESKNINLYNDYLAEKEQLLKNKEGTIEELRDAEFEESEFAEKFLDLKFAFEKAKANLENQIKQKSISDISAKAILMLDELQNTLYIKEVKKVQDNFKSIIDTLMYKKDFINDIYIDDDFNVHIYRNECMNSDEIIDVLKDRSLLDAEKLWGSAALKTLFRNTGKNTIKEICDELKRKADREIIIPVELNKDKFSKGEKQIYIMALYYSIMMINSNEMPFIIDTPFARIDMEHRANISKYFFSKLRGQVFILSTDEEIDSSHMQILQEKIVKTYLLENKDNKKTVITANRYFEGKNDI